jgi:hypothetical protein
VKEENLYIAEILVCDGDNAARCEERMFFSLSGLYMTLRVCGSQGHQLQ